MSTLKNKIGVKFLSILLAILFFISLAVFYFLKSSNRLQLSEQEKLWIEQHKVIKVAGDPAFFPFDYDTKFGKHRGLSKDYLDIVGERLGVVFEYQRCNTWSEVLDKAQKGQIELISNIGANEERSKYLNFSESYLELPFYIIANKAENSIKTFEDLKAKKIALPKDYNITYFFKKNYPHLTIIETENDRQSLNLVNLKQADATICDLASTSYYVQNDGLDNLMVADEINDACYMRFGIRKDNQMLFHLVNKALYSIDRSERNALYDKWIDLKFDRYHFYKKTMLVVLFIVLLFSGILLFYVLWSNTLKRIVEQKTRELTIIKNNLDRAVETKTHELNDTITVLEKTLEDKSKLFSLVSHDLKNSFSSLIGITDLLTEKEVDLSSKDQKDLIEVMKRSSNETYQLLINLLEWCSNKPSNSADSNYSFKLDDLILSVIKQQESMATRKQLKVNFESQKLELFSNGMKVEAIVRNLLSNAIKYSKVGDRIWIDITQKADFINLEVKDEGVGITKELADILFDAKVSDSLPGTKGEKGTGIGLMLCKQFAADIGAKIEVKSQFGEGTSFILKLPIKK
jgi:signal transduction histidine kinase